jgi:hypothetical protein
MKNSSAFSTWLGSRAWMVLLIALVQFALHLWTNAHDNIFRDEMYYVAAGQHLAFGYVEYPPFVALAARISHELFGNSVLGLRLLPAIAGAVIVLLTADMAAMLGGGMTSQVLAAVAVAFDGNILGGSGLLSMDPFDQLWWTLAAWVLIRLIKIRQPRLWLAFGLVVGVGLNTKLTMAFYLIALLIGLLLSESRKLLFQRWLVFGGALALIIFAPYLVWQMQHGFPVIEYTRSYASGKTFQASPLEFFVQQVVTHNPFSFPLWLGGLCFFIVAATGKPYRTFGWAYLLLFIFFMLQKTKFYWLAPAYPPLYAAGAYALERLVHQRSRLAWIRPIYLGLLALSGLLFVPFAIPILPAETFIAYNAITGGEGAASGKQENLQASELPQNYADRYGWKEMASALKQTYETLTPEEKAKACILAQNYGEAGAANYYGAKLGLPTVISGHNSYYLWGPQGCTGEVIISIGRPLRDLVDSFESVEAGPSWSCKYCMPYENGALIYIGKGLKVPLEEAWPTVKAFD